MNRKFTPEEESFIRENSEGVNSVDLTILFNKRFKSNKTVVQITSKRYQLGCLSGIDRSIKPGERKSPRTEFKKGNVPFNLGRKGIRISPETEFKKGQKPVNTLPIGSIIMRGDGYYWEKVKETKPSRFGWIQIHRKKWEEVHGPIPEGHTVIFLDGDRTNLDIENLVMVTRRQLVNLNKHQLLKNDPELTKSGIILGDLIIKTFDREREIKKSGGIQNG